MPAPVPPGYTRGPILFVGRPATARTVDATQADVPQADATNIEAAQDDALYQWFWDEAGGFGARILLVVLGGAEPAAYASLHARLTAWECDQLVTLRLPDRRAARDAAHGAHVEQATAIALLSADDQTIAPLLGGTPLAQTIRRANARSKAVAGFGPAAAFLCQHMLLASRGHDVQDEAAMVTFMPGLGLFNRLVVDVTTGAPSEGSSAVRLVSAVAHNPFLVALGLAPGSAAVLYPDETLQALGAPGITLVDGSGVTAVDLTALPSLDAVQGAATVHLQQGDAFNLDERRVRPGSEIDLPPVTPPRTTL